MSANLSMGNMAFNPNVNQKYDCPEYVIALLYYLGRKLCIYQYNKNQTEFESPFENTGNMFKNDTFEVQAYNWNEEKHTNYNFRWKHPIKDEEVLISWYKYLGRETTINKEFNEKFIIDMFNSCIKSLDYDEEDIINDYNS